MTEEGFASIETGKQNGSWTMLDEVEELIISADLDAEFANNENAKNNFLGFSKSVRVCLETIFFKSGLKSYL